MTLWLPKNTIFFHFGVFLSVTKNDRFSARFTYENEGVNGCEIELLAHRSGIHESHERTRASDSCVPAFLIQSLSWIPGGQIGISLRFTSPQLTSIAAPLGEIRTSRQDCSGSRHPAERKRRRPCRTHSEYPDASHHRDYIRARLRYASRSLPG